MTEQSELGRLAASFREYLKLQAEIIQLELTQRAARAIAKLASLLLLICIGSFVLITLSLSAGLYLGDLLQNNALGFLALGGLYIILFLLFLFFGDKLIQKPLRDRIIAGMLADDKNKP